MAALPAYVVLLFDGLKRKREPGVKATQMESGPPKLLKVQSRVMIRRPAVLLLTTQANYNDFITWYETTIGRAGWWDFTDPADSVLKPARFMNGELGEEIPQRKDHGLWKVPCTIETWSS